jgi:hypothetical protein
VGLMQFPLLDVLLVKYADARIQPASSCRDTRHFFVLI